MLDPFDEIVIRNYFSLSDRIASLMRYREQCRKEFYMQTMDTHIELQRVRDDQYQMITKGFRPDREVEKLLVCIEIIDRRVERNRFRKQSFEDYLADLPMEDLVRLESKYIDGNEVEISIELLASLLDEIDEIETALCFRAGVEPDPEKIAVDLNEDVEENLERLCDFFAI